MKLEIPSGAYVVAVSGGVDSMVLLDLLRLQPGMRLTVAHYDHGIREDAVVDRQLVQQTAQRYRLPFVYDRGELGPAASEAIARSARYDFLRRVQRASQANAIMTAHHQDDVLETVVINLLRGTGRKGLSSLTNGDGIIRPLLDIPKSELLDYAQRHGLMWHEDHTNSDDAYLRNRVRHQILSAWTQQQKQQLLRISRHMRDVNRSVDTLLEPVIADELDRQWFASLPYEVALEVMAAWLRLHGIKDFDSATLERLTVAAKVSSVGTFIDVMKNRQLQIKSTFLALQGSER